MANKNLSLKIIIAVVAIVLIIFLANKSSTQGTYGGLEKASCENLRASRTSVCVGSCVYVDEARRDCLLGGAYSSIAESSYQKWSFFETAIPCSEMGPPYETPLYDTANEYDLFRCIYEPGVTNCNTVADLNCDGCVSDNEFPAAMNNWLGQLGITDLEFPIIVSQWLNQEGC